MRKLVKGIFRSLGYKIERFGSSSDEFTMFKAIERSIKRGLNVQTVVDVGASDGRWTKEVAKLLPDQNYLLVEAQSPHEKELKAFCDPLSNMHYVIAAAGKEKGSIYFRNDSLFGGQAVKEKGEGTVEVPVVRLDEYAKENELQGPYLVKLDTHGFEIPILEGLTEIWSEIELLIIEVYNYELTDSSLKFYEMCSYLDERGFRPIESVDHRIRPHDWSFWQMDLFFVRKDRKEFSHNSYQ